MRRAKPISLVVKAPSRGLVTRQPPESADLMPTQSSEIQGTLLSYATYQRAAAAAQNVRYEDGVVCAAPGYERISLSSALLQGFVAHWRLDEAGGTRFDASPAHLDLTDVPGTAPSVADILSDVGIIGNAALFPTMPPWGQLQDSFSADSSLLGPFVSPLYLLARDSFTSDSALGGGFISRIVTIVPWDSFGTDSALGSGSLTEIVYTVSAPHDSFSANGSLGSGAYTLTVLAVSAPHDSFSANGSLGSGAYTQTVIVTSAPGDSFSADGSLGPGAYTETEVTPVTVSDSFSLTSTLVSGSY